MAGAVLAAVLFAALLHASWNAAIKAEADQLLAAVAVTIGAAVLGAAALPFLAPPQAASWPFIAASGALQVLYYLLLAATYREADISRAYPLMRGSAPLLVTLANFGAEPLHGGQLLAIALIFAGGAAIFLGETRTVSRRGTALALATAAVIAAYTLVDGTGVRRSGAPAAYTAWLFLLTGIGVPLACRARVAGRLLPYLSTRLPLALAGGAATAGAYGIALWAMTRAPVAVVAALRETRSCSPS